MYEIIFEIPAGVTVAREGDNFVVKGAKGELCGLPVLESIYGRFE